MTEPEEIEPTDEELGLPSAKMIIEALQAMGVSSEILSMCFVKDGKSYHRPLRFFEDDRPAHIDELARIIVASLGHRPDVGYA